MWKLECPFCGVDGEGMTCIRCGEPLDYARTGQARPGPGRGVWRYRKFLPPVGEPVTLFEGGTPLYDCGDFFVKFEGANPTGSFKDRGMTVGVSAARSRGAKRLVCASTGNTSASLAAYSARAGLSCRVLVPRGKIAAGKLAQAIAYGAEIEEIDGNFDEALARVRREPGGEILNSVNPLRIEGQKTIAFEICEELGRAPDAVVLPVGNGGNLRAIWKGFREWGCRPRLIAAQAEGAAWLAGGPLDHPETVATAIRIGRPVNGRYVRRALEDSGGEAVVVSDREILEAQRRLASRHGIFVEPASAAPIAALARRPLEGLVVCIATGHGLKDPDAPLRT